MIRRLRAAATAARDIEQLIEELPVIADLSVMTDAFLNEAVSAFAPQIASVYWHEGTTFRIVASHGLSRVEQGLTVQESQPLFEQVLLSSEPVLIAPVDLARGLVVGVAGARTEALMVGPVHVDGVCIAALVVGRNDFSDADLDRMATLAHEAGPGLALARALQGLRAKY
ncbi:MAG TPA: GAF domain-containing protein [Actinomycetota bacterium]|nr:GAF domain-containing protein [Actinomycetota bacterium]